MTVRFFIGPSGGHLGRFFLTNGQKGCVRHGCSGRTVRNASVIPNGTFCETCSCGPESDREWSTACTDARLGISDWWAATKSRMTYVREWGGGWDWYLSTKMINAKKLRQKLWKIIAGDNHWKILNFWWKRCHRTNQNEELISKARSSNVQVLPHCWVWIYACGDVWNTEIRNLEKNTDLTVQNGNEHKNALCSTPKW